MSALGGWILSILGVAVIGAVIDLILPSGRMNKFVKSVFAAVTVLIIILPLPHLLKNGCRTDGFLWEQDVPLQDDYLNYTAAIKKNALLKGLRAAMEADGITLGDIEITGDFSGNAPVIEKVRINLSQVVMAEQWEHIHKYTTVRTKVAEYLAVDEDVVELYEQ